MDTKAIETKCHNRQKNIIDTISQTQNVRDLKMLQNQNLIKNKTPSTQKNRVKISQIQKFLDSKTQTNENKYTRNTILFKKNSYIREFFINHKIM